MWKQKQISIQKIAGMKIREKKKKYHIETWTNSQMSSIFYERGGRIYLSSTFPLSLSLAHFS